LSALRISGEAEADLVKIAEYTQSKWGPRQAEVYLAQLEDGFNLLARNPSAGRPCEWILPGIRRFEIGKHVVFYRSEFEGIRVVRVLHQSMLAVKSRFED
jgi:toxin ParE1/3/4